MQYRISLWYLLNVPCDRSLFIHQNLIYSAYRRVKRKKGKKKLHRFLFSFCLTISQRGLGEPSYRHLASVYVENGYKVTSIKHWYPISFTESSSSSHSLCYHFLDHFYIIYFGSQTRNMTLRLWSFLHGDRLMVFVKADNQYSSHFATIPFFFFKSNVRSIPKLNNQLR